MQFLTILRGIENPRLCITAPTNAVSQAHEGPVEDVGRDAEFIDESTYPSFVKSVRDEGCRLRRRPLRLGLRQSD